ncbi:MAG: hypothetical protein ACK4R3_02075 [Aliihoeflea sp.]
MSRVLLATSLLAALPIAAEAGSISVLPGPDGSTPSIIERGTAAEPRIETVVPTKAETKRVVTPMVMRGGISGGAAPVPTPSAAQAPEAEFDAETNGGELE